MKRWPLRWKVALYSAGLGIVATIAGAATTWTLMRRSEIAVFDKRLAQEDYIVFEAGTHTDEIKLSYRDYEKIVKPRVEELAVKIQPMKPG